MVVSLSHRLNVLCISSIKNCIRIEHIPIKKEIKAKLHLKHKAAGTIIRMIKKTSYIDVCVYLYATTGVQLEESAYMYVRTFNLNSYTKISYIIQSLLQSCNRAQLILSINIEIRNAVVTDDLRRETTTFRNDLKEDSKRKLPGKLTLVETL